MEIINKVKKFQSKKWLYILPKGELDMASAEQFRLTITGEMLKSGCRMLWLDFSNISFIDSSGLGVILGRYRELAPLEGKIWITNTSPQVYRLLIAAGLHRIIQIEEPAGARIIKEGN